MMLQRGPSKRPLVKRAAFRGLNRQSANKPNFKFLHDVLFLAYAAPQQEA
jgi:hypothetical protein